jgi:hypothetical protein
VRGLRVCHLFLHLLSPVFKRPLALFLWQLQPTLQAAWIPPFQSPPPKSLTPAPITYLTVQSLTTSFGSHPHPKHPF